MGILNSDIVIKLIGKTRSSVLSLLFSNPEKAYYLQQIIRVLGMGNGSIQRELKLLTELGLVNRSVSGKQVYFQANKESPIYTEIKGLIEKVDNKGNTNSDARLISNRLKGSCASRNIYIPKKKIAEFCKRNHIKKLSLFGSVLRHDFTPKSDVDVLVEFEPGHTPGWAIIDMENKLSEILGYKVDLLTPNGLSRYFREQVIREAEVQYDAT